ncbi:MAG: hypothetical protein WC344_00250 [Bacilli bacterium]
MALWIASIVILSTSFLGMLIFGLSNYRETFKAKFSVLNMFPYELSYHNQGKLILFYRFFLYLYVAFSLTPALLMVGKYVNFSGYLSYLVMIGFIFVINAVIFLTMHIIQAKFVRLHSIVATAYFAFSVLEAGAVSIILFNLYFSIFQADISFLVFAILEAVLGFAILLVMINPNLRNWAQMKSEPGADGTGTLVRPKFFILAFSEWLVIFINFGVQILLLLAYL